MKHIPVKHIFRSRMIPSPFWNHTPLDVFRYMQSNLRSEGRLCTGTARGLPSRGRGMNSPEQLLKESAEEAVPKKKDRKYGEGKALPPSSEKDFMAGADETCSRRRNRRMHQERMLSRQGQDVLKKRTDVPKWGGEMRTEERPGASAGGRIQRSSRDRTTDKSF